jgi:hypothetical protein
MENYVELETAVARQRIQNAEVEMIPQQKQMGNAEIGRSITTKPEITFVELLNAIRESLSDPTCSEDEEDGDNKDDDDQDTRHGKLSEGEEHGWVMGTISKTVQHHLEIFRQKQMSLD